MVKTMQARIHFYQLPHTFQSLAEMHTSSAAS